MHVEEVQNNRNAVRVEAPNRPGQECLSPLKFWLASQKSGFFFSVTVSTAFF